MSEDFGSDFLSIVDDEGNEYELELLDSLEHNGFTYYALIEAKDGQAEEDSSEDELIIMKVLIEDGEEILSTPDTDEELNEVYNLFMDRLFEDDDSCADTSLV
ncbi:MAG: DUF1292 domain-containing protein [Clostridiales bacterium]|nr:DUF1292 domain-containing protein [Clostridiales bacterium]